MTIRRMTLLYILAVLIWGPALAYSVPSAVSAFRHTARQGNPMRLGVAMISATILLGSLRWLFAHESECLLAFVFVPSRGTGCFVLRVMRTNGNGRHVR